METLRAIVIDMGRLVIVLGLFIFAMGQIVAAAKKMTRALRFSFRHSVFLRYEVWKAWARQRRKKKIGEALTYEATYEDHGRRVCGTVLRIEDPYVIERNVRGFPVIEQVAQARIRRISLK